MRVAGVNIPDNKKLEIGLTYIYGIGRTNVHEVIKLAQVDAKKRVKDLTEDELGKLQKALDGIKIEGELKADLHANIRRLKEIGSYRGHRHAKSLPVRGQRTRSNARTKRGKRMTIGAIKKEVAERMGIIAKSGGTQPPK